MRKGKIYYRYDVPREVRLLRERTGNDRTTVSVSEILEEDQGSIRSVESIMITIMTIRNHEEAEGTLRFVGKIIRRSWERYSFAYTWIRVSFTPPPRDFVVSISERHSLYLILYPARHSPLRVTGFTPAAVVGRPDPSFAV